MNLFKALFQRPIWTMSVYELDQASEILNLTQIEPKFKFKSFHVRLGKDYQSTNADPFLFEHNERLYLFYEVQTDFDKGEIWAKSMGVDQKWISHGMILKENFHLSFPLVFKNRNKIYLIPESFESGKVFLYESLEFPYNWKKYKILIGEKLVDVAFLETNEGLYLFGTTLSFELKMYYAESFENEFRFVKTIFENNKKKGRNGGNFLKVDQKIFRISQNCQNVYGESISLNQVHILSPQDYSEESSSHELLNRNKHWRRLGSHHLSLAEFNRKTYVAVDGKGYDRFYNTFIYILLIFIDKVKKKVLWN